MDPLKYFEDFLSIPRESGNEDEISNYLVQFAKDNNLEYYKDESNNVIIKKKSNINSKETIILQGHTDMVCTSINEYDFKNKGIDWYIEDGYYKAHGTTLGADNGIGCAIILSVLSDDNINIPNIEAVFTTNEETNMNGAKTLDYSKITGKKLISIDGTDEGVIDVSSAGMTSMQITKKLRYDQNELNTYKIKIYGLKGGHSGVDIDKNHGNAIKIMHELLNQLDYYNLVSMQGGDKYNVIPSSCECIITSNVIPSFNYEQYSKIGLKINIEEIEKSENKICNDDLNYITSFINNIPSGVISYCDNGPKTSLNLAAIEINENTFCLKVSIRSSSKDEEKSIVELIDNMASSFNVEIIDTVPFFEYKEKSFLREKLIDNYKKLFNKEVILNHVHAGLEGGVFAEYISDIDICVIAPNLFEIHTVNEKVEIESVKRVHKWLINTLESI